MSPRRPKVAPLSPAWRALAGAALLAAGSVGCAAPARSGPTADEAGLLPPIPDPSLRCARSGTSCACHPVDGAASPFPCDQASVPDGSCHADLDYPYAGSCACHPGASGGDSGLARVASCYPPPSSIDAGGCDPAECHGSSCGGGYCCTSSCQAGVCTSTCS